MNLDFHTHGKLAKYLPFSTEYTDWLLGEARQAGLDAICLTEHFNTKQFDELYGYIAAAGDPCGDAWVLGGLKVFPGMETDIAEGGHVLSIGPMDAIRELNRRLEPYKAKDRFLPFAALSKLLAEYPVLVGAGHPFREGGNIPQLPAELLERFDFLDLNGKDIAEDRERTMRLTKALGERLGGCRSIERVELLPYHTLGVHKYEALGWEYKLRDVRENTPEQIDRAAALLREYFPTVVVN